MGLDMLLIQLFLSGYNWLYKKFGKTPKKGIQTKNGNIYIIIYQPENTNKTFIDFVYGIKPKETDGVENAASSVPENMLAVQNTLENAVKNLSETGINLPYEIIIDKPLSKINLDVDLKSKAMENALLKIVTELITYLEK